MATLQREFIDTVVAIGRKDAVGTHWLGAGMSLVRTYGKDQEIAGGVIVTCRHVLKGDRPFIVRANHSPEGSAHERPLDRVHPDIKDVSPTLHPTLDIAVTTYPAFQDGRRASGFLGTGRRISADTSQLREAGVGEGHPVVVLGFPMQLVGTVSNTPTVRAGVIAQIGDCYEGRTPHFVIDVPVYPGNSGGPVALWPAPQHKPEWAGKPIIIGMVEQSIQYAERLVSDQTERQLMILEQNSGLTRVTPMDQIEPLVKKHVEKQLAAMNPP